MDNSNGSLGRGLEALIPKKAIQDTITSNNGIHKIPVASIAPNPEQPRKNFDEQELLELANSIKEHGILQPLVITSIGENQYELVAGERRLEACKRVGIDKVPAIVRTAGEQQKLELALVENVQRSDLNPIEEAEAFVRLIEEFGLTQEDVAGRVSKSREYASNTIRLLGLPGKAKDAIREGKITRGHAKAVLGLESSEQQLAMLNKILNEKLSVRSVEKKTQIERGENNRIKKDPEIMSLEEELRGIFGTRVTIKGNRKSGEVVIDYYSGEEFDSLVDKLKGGKDVY